MKIPDRIVGVLDLNGTRFPFELMKDTFELNGFEPLLENDIS